MTSPLPRPDSATASAAPAAAFAPGCVCFVGAGPGAADLLTVRAVQRLAQADVVLADALLDPAVRDLAPQARWIEVGKRGFCDSTSQTAINALLVKQAQSGARVLRLKGGDPSVFGRLEEELHALALHGIASEVVPGVTAALTAAAATQRPLTRRGQGRSVALTTAMTRQGQLSVRAPQADTEVFYMAGKQLPALGRALAEAGWALDTACHVVSRAGFADQLDSHHALSRLGEASMLHAGRPTVVIVGVGATAVLPASPLTLSRRATLAEDTAQAGGQAVPATLADHPAEMIRTTETAV